MQMQLVLILALMAPIVFAQNTSDIQIRNKSFLYNLEVFSLASQRSHIAFALIPNMTQWEYLLLPITTIVGNDGWNAFHVAHKCMDTISLKMQQAGESCVELSAKTEVAFVRVMGLTAELSGAVGGAQGKHDVLIIEAEAALEAGKTEQALMEEQKAFMVQRYNEQKQVVNQARHDYEKAIDDIPSGWEGVFMCVVQDVLPTIIGAIAGVPVMPISGHRDRSSTNVQVDVSGMGQAKPRDIHTPIILQIMKNIARRIPQIRSYVNEALGGEENEDSGSDITGFLITMRTILEQTLSSFDTYPDSLIKSMSIGVIRTLMQVVSEVEEQVKKLEQELGSELRTAVLEKIDEAAGELDKLVAAGEASGVTMGYQLPKQETQNHQSGGGGRGGGCNVGENERYIAKLRLENLNSAENRLESVFRDINKFNRQLIAVELRLTQIDLEKVTLEEVRELLRQVLGILGEIRRLWSRLVQFFSIVATRAKILSEDFLDPFLEMAETGGVAIQDEGDELREQLMTMLKEQALDINTVAYLLHTMAKIYVRISGRHVLEKLAGLAKLLSAKDDEERQKWKNELDEEAVDAREDILAIIRKTHEKYGRDVLEKRLELESAIQEMGGISAAEQERITQGLAIAKTELATAGTEEMEPEEPDWNMDDII